MAAIAVAVIAYARLRPAPAVSGDSARIRALEERLALLERQRRSEAVVRTAGGGESHLFVPAPPPPAATELQAQPVVHRAAAPELIDEVAVKREYFGDLDVRLASEPRDVNWSTATEEKLRRSVRDLVPRINVDKAECGQTMCRVETTVPDAREEVAALDRFLAASLDALPEAVVNDGDRPGRHVVYFARTGSGFPPMSAPESGPH